MLLIFYSERRSIEVRFSGRLLVAITDPLQLLKQKNGAAGRDRTCDLLVTNELLYQLSYIGILHIISFFIEAVKAVEDFGAGVWGDNLV